MLIGVMTIVLVVTGVASGGAVSPVVVAEEHTGKVTLRYDLVPAEANRRAQLVGTKRVPGADLTDDWYQGVACNPSNGAPLFTGTNPNGNGSLRFRYGAASSRISWHGDTFAWRVPNDSAAVEYYNIDLTGFGDGESIKVTVGVCSRDSEAGPRISVDTSLTVNLDKVPESWVLVSHTWAASHALNWNSTDNNVLVSRTAASTDTLAVVGIRVDITGAVPLPGPFDLVSPPDQAMDEPMVGTLAWEASANADSYDVYWGTSNPPPFLRSVTEESTSYSGSLDERYRWYVVARNAVGETECNARFAFVTTTTAVREEESSTPGRYTFQLERASPNPFRWSTSIRYALPRDGSAELRILNSSGAVVRTLRDGPCQRGMHRVVWDGTDDRGVCVGKGVYFCSLAAGEDKSLRKVVRLD